MKRLRISEPARKIPVMADVDAVVCGGGTAGVAAAICAAREGLSVVLIEKSSIPGGMVTHVTQWFSDFANKGGFPKEFITHLRNKGIDAKPYYNPWLVLPYLDSLLKDADVRVIYLADAVAPIIKDKKLQGVIIESKSGRTAIRAKIVIDATGDGDIADRAGARFKQGRAGDGAVQAISLSQILMNYTAGHISHDKMNEIFVAAVKKSGRKYWQPYSRWHPFPVVGTTNTLIHTVPHATGYDPTDAAQLSDALIEMRRQAYELYDLLKNNSEEFKDIEFGPFSAIPGVRESRRIICDRMVTKKDLLSGAKFVDGLFTVTQGIDIHRRDRKEPAIMCEKIQPYEIPYGALLPKGLENILVVGRCIGGDHEAMASYRIIGDCMAMGEAAALAAKSAVTGKCSLRKISVSKLVSEMSARGYERQGKCKN
ncbi:MAG TPA: hypothetical protein DCZ94_15540 [Lentisphaeria bacterium]|nr:MAG: hypothetical protein A2X48_17075 [Lentisphaerae bacterium GWF2_49_21]HBC88363.1 hypothetical protein [Lentisphaeria bacterium]